jgi:uncharacterized RDD family membrane protein YckC
MRADFFRPRIADGVKCDNLASLKALENPRMSAAQAPAAAPVPESPPVPATPVTPSLPRRMACWLYEGMLMFGVVFIAGYLFSALTQTRHAMDNRHELQAFLFLVFGIYFTWFWAKGQTLAMKTWHIRVVDTQGRPISQGRALWRYVLSWLWFLPPMAVGYVQALGATEILVLTLGWVAVWAILARFHPAQQFWHDAWAGTRLISVAPEKPARKA